MSCVCTYFIGLQDVSVLISDGLCPCLWSCSYLFRMGCACTYFVGLQDVSVLISLMGCVHATGCEQNSFHMGCVHTFFLTGCVCVHFCGCVHTLSMVAVLSSYFLSYSCVYVSYDVDS